MVVKMVVMMIVMVTMMVMKIVGIDNKETCRQSVNCLKMHCL